MGYSPEHERLRRALVRAFVEGSPCPYCHEAMWSAQRLALGHRDDEDGRSIPGQWLGLCHYRCNASHGGAVNPWGVRTRAQAARAARSPERQREIDDKAARRLRREDRAAYDRVQEEAAAVERTESQGREWLEDALPRMIEPVPLGYLPPELKSRQPLAAGEQENGRRDDRDQAVPSRLQRLAPATVLHGHAVRGYRQGGVDNGSVALPVPAVGVMQHLAAARGKDGLAFPELDSVHESHQR